MRIFGLNFRAFNRCLAPYPTISFSRSGFVFWKAKGHMGWQFHLQKKWKPSYSRYFALSHGYGEARYQTLHYRFTGYFIDVWLDLGKEPINTVKKADCLSHEY